MPEAKKLRIGEKRTAHCGLEMEIVQYRNGKDIDIRFSNGAVAEHKSYIDFLNGRISPPGESHIGEKKIANCGVEMEIVAYRNASDIDVKFANGTIVEHRTYFSFLKGKIQPPVERIGEEKVANCGIPARIVVYRSATDLDVEFSDGNVAKHCTYNNFRKGKLPHPDIKRRSDSNFYGVWIKKAFQDGDAVYYNCTFPDGTRDLCTPQEIMERMHVPTIF